MKIVIWKAHGDISVYEADTADQLANINTWIMSCLDRYGLDDEIRALKWQQERFPGDYIVAKSVFNDLRNLLTDSGDDDNFETLELSETRREI